jgi:hypothetical protein
VALAARPVYGRAMLSWPARMLLLLVAVAGLGGAPARAEPPADPAAAAVERCRSADFDQERDCYAAALEARLAETGAAATLALLDRLAALDPDVRRDGHFYAHRIGILALRSPAEVGRVFATCTPGWQSGCYHGVIQSYFMAVERAGGGVTTESVDALCGDHRAARPDLLFQCTHGLGHGLAIFHRHDLPRALDSCDLLSREAEGEMCYAGAFMENIVNATQPHHAAAPAADASAKPNPGGHAAGEHHQAPGTAATPAAPAFRALDPADLHYPCSVLAEKYLIACYTIQTSAMLHHSGQDVSRTAAECARAPEKARATCFLSLGRDVSTIALGDHRQAVRLCGLADAAFRPACHSGVVASLVNMNAEPAEGIPYCRAVAEAESKRACYAAVGQQALVLPHGEAKREQACRAAETDLLDACLGRPVPPAAPGAAPSAPPAAAPGRR